MYVIKSILWKISWATSSSWQIFFFIFNQHLLLHTLIAHPKHKTNNMKIFNELISRQNIQLITKILPLFHITKENRITFVSSLWTKIPWYFYNEYKNVHMMWHLFFFSYRYIPYISKKAKKKNHSSHVHFTSSSYITFVTSSFNLSSSHIINIFSLCCFFTNNNNNNNMC